MVITVYIFDGWPAALENQASVSWLTGVIIVHLLISYAFMFMMDFVIKWSDSLIEATSHASICSVVEKHLALLLLRVATLGVDQVASLICITVNCLVLILWAFVELLLYRSAFLGRLH